MGTVEAKWELGTGGGWERKTLAPRRIAARVGGREEAALEDAEAECRKEPEERLRDKASRCRVSPYLNLDELLHLNLEMKRGELERGKVMHANLEELLQARFGAAVASEFVISKELPHSGQEELLNLGSAGSFGALRGGSHRGFESWSATDPGASGTLGRARRLGGFSVGSGRETL